MRYAEMVISKMRNILCVGAMNITIYVMCYILKQLTSRINFPIWIQMQNSITLCLICGGM